MKRLLKLLIIGTIFFSTFSIRNVKGSELDSLFKANKEFIIHYENCIPANIRVAFETDGGTLVVFPENGGTKNVYVNGWSGGQTVTGYTDISGLSPVIYLNEKIVNKSKNFYPGTTKRVVCHEMGHYTNAKVNEINTGVKSYYHSPEFVMAFATERLNYNKSKNMSEGLKSGFERTADISEYYANIFAGICIEPKVIEETFPLSYALVLNDMNSF